MVLVLSNTFATKLSYRPVTDVLLRATRGTSFRAPTLEKWLKRRGSSNICV